VREAEETVRRPRIMQVKRRDDDRLGGLVSGALVEIECVGAMK